MSFCFLNVPDLFHEIDGGPRDSEARRVFNSVWVSVGFFKNDLINTGKDFSGKHFPEDHGCSEKHIVQNDGIALYFLISANVT